MHNPIVCRYAPLAELQLTSPHDIDRWLSREEQDELMNVGAVERRTSWLAGRMLAKRMLLQCADAWTTAGQLPTARDIRIVSRNPENKLGTRPQVYVGGQRLPLQLSISHTSRGALAAASVDAAVRVGVDLVQADQIQPGSLDWCFTPAERLSVAAAARSKHTPARLWAMKEALFKTSDDGKRFAPWRIDAAHTALTGQSAQAAPHLTSLHCWTVDGQIAALAIVRTIHSSQEPISTHHPI